MFSILIPSYNNLEYLKTCIDSLKKNSTFDHQIIVHINEGTDGSFDYIKENNLEYTYSKDNIGMPRALNKASKLSKFDYVLISHDDFYYCPGWDTEFVNEINNIKHNNFYSIKTFDFQGTTKCPGLVHKDIWEKVGGWSEEFSPTGGDDTDFAMKLWKMNIRIFKGLGKSLAYHFGSITTRKKDKSLFTYLGSRGNKIFLKKWGISINFFENFYLRGCKTVNKTLICNEYDGPLSNPKKNLTYFLLFIKDTIYYFYLKFTFYK